MSSTVYLMKTFGNRCMTSKTIHFKIMYWENQFYNRSQLFICISMLFIQHIINRFFDRSLNIHICFEIFSGSLVLKWLLQSIWTSNCIRLAKSESTSGKHEFSSRACSLLQAYRAFTRLLWTQNISLCRFYGFTFEEEVKSFQNTQCIKINLAYFRCNPDLRKSVTVVNYY